MRLGQHRVHVSTSNRASQLELVYLPGVIDVQWIVSVHLIPKRGLIPLNPRRQRNHRIEEVPPLLGVSNRVITLSAGLWERCRGLSKSRHVDVYDWGVDVVSNISNLSE